MASELGYAHREYAQSLAEFGAPLALARSGGWLLERAIPESDDRDAMGCYPLLCCPTWSGLKADLDELSTRGLVAVSAVPDPFGDYDGQFLRDCFGDVVTPFKEHFVTDMLLPLEESVSKHHRKYARKAQDHVRCEVVEDPPAFLDEWMGLHQHLVARHAIAGIRGFSRKSFARQLRIPGIVAVRAIQDGATVGAQLWFRHEHVAYGHVLAFTPQGYESGAPYALYWFALEHFVGKVRWCSFGGVSGTDITSAGGLSQFKRGWSTGTRTAYFCGRIFDRAKYDGLAKGAAGHFFPAYRTSI